MNRIFMIAAAASVLTAFGAGTGNTRDKNPATIANTADAVAESVLWSFGAAGDGFAPETGLIRDSRGNLYGTTLEGGANDAGIAFELSPPHGRQTEWGERVLWSFGTGDDGKFPRGTLIADRSGNFYGTTTAGGTNAASCGDPLIGCGTIFELSPPAGQQTEWTERVLWSFGTNGDGVGPAAGLLADKSDNLYGTTQAGGANSCDDGFTGCGTIFELSPPVAPQTQWREAVLWSFGANGDGVLPEAGLLADKRGNLYGTTSSGGVSDYGTAFELSPPAGQDPQWSERVLWSFGATIGDGASPAASLIADRSGNLFGTSESTTIDSGSSDSFGTVFELSPPRGRDAQWSESVLWNFGASGDGSGPAAGLATDKRGNLYGTTSGGGGAHDAGVAFELSPPFNRQTQWRERILWSFGSDDDGTTPVASLLSDQRGNFYGTTAGGGANDQGGTVFKLSLH